MYDRATASEPISAAHSSNRLPARVVRAIQMQADRGEILASWVQAAIVVLLAGLYIVAPSTSPPDAVFRPVPWALAVYAMFTLFRLERAHKRQLTPAMRVVSIFVDIAVLMVTIWSFHIQYGQPAAFYLKAPTFAYVFIFIALRTLSFSPRHVLLAGGIAAIGWLALVGYALAEPGGTNLLTRDYVAYMTSARILIGGEIDKVISILVVAGLLAAGAARAHQLLERAVAEESAAMQLRRFFSPDVAETLLRADELFRPGEGESREAAAMFIDLRGFTKLAARLEPKALIALLGEYHRIVVFTVQRHGGSITTYLGDGIMATFGAVRSNDTYAADALRCATELVERLTDWGEDRCQRDLPDPGVGIGVEAGTVTCGAIGVEDRLEYAVIGDPVNRAAKLQNHTKSEGARALTTAETVDRAASQGYITWRSIEVRRARSVAGLNELVDVAVIAGPGRQPGHCSEPLAA